MELQHGLEDCMRSGTGMLLEDVATTCRWDTPLLYRLDLVVGADDGFAVVVGVGNVVLVLDPVVVVAIALPAHTLLE